MTCGCLIMRIKAWMYLCVCIATRLPAGKWRNVLVLLSRANPMVLTHSIESHPHPPQLLSRPSLPHTFPVSVLFPLRLLNDLLLLP